MRTIIAGSRHIANGQLIEKAVAAAAAQGITVDVLVCGMAKGVDMMAWRWAKARQLPVLEFPADWDNLGKSAGPIRNNQMAENADALIAIWDGKSRGTAHMIRAALAKGLKVYVYRV